MKILQIDSNLFAENFALELAGLQEATFVLRASFSSKILCPICKIFNRNHYKDINMPVESIHLDLVQVFRASPVIYSILLFFSLFAFVIWLYSLLTLKTSQIMPESFIHKVRGQLMEKRYDAALLSCQNCNHFSAAILTCGISSRKHGHQVMMEAIQTEGRRCGAILWQRIALLNDIAVIAPMLGLLGTVLGLFYAFYDINRTPDTLASIFDGLGIAVGTTVAGLIVAILAMIFYATLKFRVVKLLNILENEALSLGTLIETK